MKSVTSLSGGKSSAMMAVTNPTDHYVFAVVLTDDQNAVPKDKGLLKECRDRIPWFTASRELDQTLINMLNLEQLLGQRIDWVAYPYTFDQLISQSIDHPGYRSGKLFLPNKTHRVCTELLKINPIFYYWYRNFAPKPILMNIGFRWDEPNRVAGWNCDKDKFKFPFSCNTFGDRRFNWQTIEWRFTEFPLYRQGVGLNVVAKFWLEKEWKFPEVSNCDFCFHHKPVQQQRQQELYPERSQWWMDWEKKTGRSFGDVSLETIFQQPLFDVFDQESESLCACSD